VSALMFIEIPDIRHSLCCPGIRFGGYQGSLVKKRGGCYDDKVCSEETGLGMEFPNLPFRNSSTPPLLSRNPVPSLVQDIRDLLFEQETGINNNKYQKSTKDMNI